MSIKGFQTTEGIQKYDWNALENKLFSNSFGMKPWDGSLDDDRVYDLPNSNVRLAILNSFAITDYVPPANELMGVVFNIVSRSYYYSTGTYVTEENPCEVVFVGTYAEWQAAINTAEFDNNSIFVITDAGTIMKNEAIEYVLLCSHLDSEKDEMIYAFTEDAYITSDHPIAKGLVYDFLISSFSTSDSEISWDRNLADKKTVITSSGTWVKLSDQVITPSRIKCQDWYSGNGNSVTNNMVGPASKYWTTEKRNGEVVAHIYNDGVYKARLRLQLTSTETFEAGIWTYVFELNDDGTQSTCGIYKINILDDEPDYRPARYLSSISSKIHHVDSDKKMSLKCEDISDIPFKKTYETTTTWDGIEADDRVTVSEDGDTGVFRLAPEYIEPEKLLGSIIEYKDVATGTVYPLTISWVGKYAELESIINEGSYKVTDMFIITDFSTYADGFPDRVKFYGVGMGEAAVIIGIEADGTEVTEDDGFPTETGIYVSYIRDAITPKKTIEFDGDLTNRTVSGGYVKVSDEIISMQQVMENSVVYVDDGVETTSTIPSDTSKWVYYKDGDDITTYTLLSSAITGNFKLQHIASDTLTEGVWFEIAEFNTDETAAIKFTSRLDYYETEPTKGVSVYPTAFKIPSYVKMDSQFVDMSWDNITGKPFGEKIGMDSLLSYNEDEDYYNIHDFDLLYGGTLTLTDSNDGETISFPIYGEALLADDLEAGVIPKYDCCYIVQLVEGLGLYSLYMFGIDDTTMEVYDLQIATMTDATYTDAPLLFSLSSDISDSYTPQISNVSYTKIDKKYLPDDLASGGTGTGAFLIDLITTVDSNEASIVVGDDAEHTITGNLGIQLAEAVGIGQPILVKTRTAATNDNVMFLSGSMAIGSSGDNVVYTITGRLSYTASTITQSYDYSIVFTVVSGQGVIVRSSLDNIADIVVSPASNIKYVDFGTGSVDLTTIDFSQYSPGDLILCLKDYS